MGQDLHLDVDERRIHCGIWASWTVKNPALSRVAEEMAVTSCLWKFWSSFLRICTSTTSGNSTLTCLLLNTVY